MATSVQKAVAPWWHTAILMAFFLGTAAGGAALQHHARGHADLVQHRPDVVLLYISLIAGEWGLVYYVWKGGLRPSRITLLEFVGGRWNSAKAVFLDVVLAIGLWSLWQGISFLWTRWVSAGHAASISQMMPHGWVERALWVLLAASAGISEELVFRGYLQRQFTAFTGRTFIASLLQVSIFAVAHGYQGVRSCLVIAIYGTLFTLLAIWRKSLRPGMIAHAWTDILGGLMG